MPHINLQDKIGAVHKPNMYKKILCLLLISSLLASCISISGDSEAPETHQANFVTATLAPTKPGFIPPTRTPTPVGTSTPASAITALPDCKDSAVLLRDVTIPDNTQVKAGEIFTKTWELQNSGTCPWVNYTLVFAAGDQMNAPLSAPIPDTAPNEKAQISLPLTAPSSNGTYTGYFTLNDANGKNIDIGIEKTFWVRVVVGTGSVPATSTGNISTPNIPAGGNSNCAYSQNAGYVQEIGSLINQARKNANLKALTVNGQLASAAQAHSVDMGCNNFLGHTGSDGSSILSRINQAGYHGYYVEIIAIGTPQNAMDQWQADAAHWNVVLDPQATSMGVGYAYYSGSDYGGYITVDMGNP